MLVKVVYCLGCIVYRVTEQNKVYFFQDMLIGHLVT